MQFPYERYETLAEPLTVYYPTSEESFARWVFQTIDAGGKLLMQLLGQPLPEMDILVVEASDWRVAPHSDVEELDNPHPYWTDATTPPCLVVPLALDAIFGDPTQEKWAFMLYHELSLAFLEADPRPYPVEYPLWADEWQLKFAALWLSQQTYHHHGIVYKDLHEQYAEIFEAEEDGKTPITVRGFDWYDDTVPVDYLCYELLLEQLAHDILAQYGPEVLPRFLKLYRTVHEQLLSDEVTIMLGTVLGAKGAKGAEWLDELVYF